MKISKCENCESKNISFPEDDNFAICLDCRYITKINIDCYECDAMSFLIWTKLYKNKHTSAKRCKR